MTKAGARHHNVDVFLVGIGGQGVLLASEIVSQAALSAGYDVKKSEVHGMSQRGGSVTSSVRFGKKVHSPLIERGQAGILVAFVPEEGRRWRHYLRKGGLLLEAPARLRENLTNPRTFNIAVMGILSTHLSIPVPLWLDSIAGNVPAASFEDNKHAFFIGREIGSENNDLG